METDVEIGAITRDRSGFIARRPTGHEAGGGPRNTLAR